MWTVLYTLPPIAFFIALVYLAGVLAVILRPGVVSGPFADYA